MQRRFVCVKECPLTDNSTIECHTSNVSRDDCSQLEIYATQPLATYCMPLDQAKEILGEAVTHILSVAPLQAYFADVYMAWPLILGMVGVSIAVSLFYSILIRYFAGCMVWTMIFVLLVLLLCIGLVTALLPSVQLLQDIFKYD